MSHNPEWYKLYYQKNKLAINLYAEQWKLTHLARTKELSARDYIRRKQETERSMLIGVTNAIT